MSVLRIAIDYPIVKHLYRRHVQRPDISLDVCPGVILAHYFACAGGSSGGIDQRCPISATGGCSSR